MGLVPSTGHGSILKGVMIYVCFHVRIYSDVLTSAERSLSKLTLNVSTGFYVKDRARETCKSDGPSVS